MCPTCGCLAEALAPRCKERCGRVAKAAEKNIGTSSVLIGLLMLAVAVMSVDVGGVPGHAIAASAFADTHDYGTLSSRGPQQS